MRLLLSLCLICAPTAFAQSAPIVSASVPTTNPNFDTDIDTLTTPTASLFSTTRSLSSDDGSSPMGSITSTVEQPETYGQLPTGATSSSELGATVLSNLTSTSPAAGEITETSSPAPTLESGTSTISSTPIFTSSEESLLVPVLPSSTTTSDGAVDNPTAMSSSVSQSEPTGSFESTPTTSPDLTSGTVSVDSPATTSIDAPDSSVTLPATPSSTDTNLAYAPGGFTQTMPSTQTEESAQTTCTPLSSIESQNAPYLGNFSQHPCPGEPKSFWRLPCRGQSGIGRIDPLMDPGGPGAHVHTIAGGNGFGLNATFESLAHSTCTSCQVKRDKSAYWTPTLNFMHENGTTVMVEQLGGMLAYYKSFANTIPFPEGFSMIAGDPYVRNFTGIFPDVPQSDVSIWKDDPDEIGTPEQQFFLMQRAIGFNCLNYYGSLPPEASLYRHQLPTKEYMDYQCIDGLRLELAFPTCGNGSIDSADHKSHMKYPSLVQQGVCPTGYDILFPLLFYETIYNTWAFAGVNGTFLLSYGDPIGTGYHGDFMMGWESEGMLEQAINECRNISGRVEDCAILDLQSAEEQMACHFAVPEAVKDDEPVGPRQGLAVDVPVQYGPGQATTYPVAGQSGIPTKSFELPSPPSTYVGNLSLHPYGHVGNPTLMHMAGTGGNERYEFLTTPASTPTAAGMTPLSPLSYVSGVIAPQFSRYLSVSPINTIVTKGRGSWHSSSFSGAQPEKTLTTGCEAGNALDTITIATSFETVGDEVVQILIEDVKVVITTRRTISITETKSTTPSEQNSGTPAAITGASSYGASQEPSMYSTTAGQGDGNPSETTSLTEIHGRPQFNTVMWVLGSETFTTCPPGMESLDGGFQTQPDPTGSPKSQSESSTSSTGASETPIAAGTGDANSIGTGTTAAPGTEMGSASGFATTVTSESPTASPPDTNTDVTDLNTFTVSDGITMSLDLGFSSPQAPSTFGIPTANSDSADTDSSQSFDTDTGMSSPSVSSIPGTVEVEAQMTSWHATSTESVTASLSTSGTDVFISISSAMDY